MAKLPPAVEARVSELIGELRDGAPAAGALLLVGPGGAGKLAAAERLAAGLGLDLFRIDLGRLVSKSIGETEKALDRVFDTAEAVGAVIFFDEADDLFSQRSDVRDAHDRHANLLLEQLERRMARHRPPVVFACAGRPRAEAARLAPRQAAFPPLRARALAAARTKR